MKVNFHKLLKQFKMKHISYLILLLLPVLWACEDDDTKAFNATIPKENIEFEALPGAAKMTYKLPANVGAHYIQARYQDFKGESLTVKGSHLNNELYLPGFIEETNNIPIEIMLLDGYGNVSEPMNMSFSVKRSAASFLLDNIEIGEYWEGFKIEYSAPENATGFLHVNYLGISEVLGGKLDTLFIETIPITEGTSTKNFPDYADIKEKATTVVIVTENDRGDLAGKRVFKNVPAAIKEKFNSTSINLLDGSSYESETVRSGWKYMFDGDTKGMQFFKGTQEIQNKGGYAFVSKNSAIPGDWVFDLGESRILAGMKMFARLASSVFYPSPYYDWYPAFMAPSSFKLYGSQDYDPDTKEGSWDELGEYHENRAEDWKNWWCARAYHRNDLYTVDNVEDAEPCFVELSFDISDQAYRYLKLEVNEVFKYEGAYDYNRYNKVSFQELEIFVKQN